MNYFPQTKNISSIIELLKELVTLCSTLCQIKLIWGKGYENILYRESSKLSVKIPFNLLSTFPNILYWWTAATEKKRKQHTLPASVIIIDSCTIYAIALHVTHLWMTIKRDGLTAQLLPQDALMASDQSKKKKKKSGGWNI